MRRRTLGDIKPQDPHQETWGRPTSDLHGEAWGKQWEETQRMHPSPRPAEARASPMARRMTDIQHPSDRHPNQHGNCASVSRAVFLDNTERSSMFDPGYSRSNV